MQITCAQSLLRPLVAADAVSLTHHANDRGVWEKLRDRFPHPYTVADAEAYIAHLATRSVQTSFGIVVDGAAVGSIGLMPEAVRATTDYAFRDLNLIRVFAVPFAGSAASARVLEKAGYVREGVMRRSAVKAGVIHDQLLYAAYKEA